MSEQLAFGDRTDAPVSIAERFQHLSFAGPGIKPEVSLQRRERDHALHPAIRVGESERDAAAIGEYSRFEIEGFHSTRALNEYP